MTNAVVLASKAEVKRITLAIRMAGENLSQSLLEAQEKEVWRALGYGSWSAYIDGEFAITKRQINHLLVQAKVNKTLIEAGSAIRVSDREAREVIAKGTAVPTFEAIEQVVQERRALPKPQGRHRRAQPSLGGQLAAITHAIEGIDIAFESAGDDPLDYLPPEDRRQLERTVSKTFEWTEAWAARLFEWSEAAARHRTEPVIEEIA